MKVESYLDFNEILKIVFDISDDNISYEMSCEYGDERLRNIIIENLKTISKFEQTEDPDISRLSINDSIFINIRKSTGEIESANKLTAFETRSLAQRKENITVFDRNGEDFVPKTDLHTHFAGALSPDILIDVACKRNATYRAEYLKEIGIDINKYEQNENGQILISSVDEEDIRILKEHLAVPITTQETFNKMEEIYKLRGPFTKNPNLFADYLKALAKDYQKNGVDYAELSFSAFVGEGKGSSDYMQIMEDVLPEIEQETGVKLRFLAGLWRHSDKEWNLDDVDRIKTISKSPYIVGVDFNGHETNETIDFREEIQMLAEYAMLEDPEFTIRVHAGESPIFKNNVYQALKIAYDKHAQMEEELGKKLPMPKIRIGHALYGLDGITNENWEKVSPDEVLGLMKKMGAIVEINMSSNLALNNINKLSEIPIKRYLDSGVKVVLATDGHGLYSTAGKQEVILATAAGLTKNDFEKIKETEEEVIENIQRRDKAHPKIDDVEALYSSITYSTENGQKRFTDEVEKRIRAEKEAKVKHLLNAIENKAGAITDEDKIKEITEGKTPIMLTGASKNAWPEVSKVDKKYIALLTQVLADTLNSEAAYVITGGTNFGVEQTMHEAVHRRNEKNDDELVLLGTFTMEAEKDIKEGVEPNTITHATILKAGDGRYVNNWMDLPETQLVMTQDNGGYMIGIAGGAIVSDIIQRAYNRDVDMHLMDGPAGASTKKAHSYEGHDYAFVKIEELIKRLYERNPNIFAKDFSLDKMNDYIRIALEETAGYRDRVDSGEIKTNEVNSKTIAQADKQTGLIPHDLVQFGNGFRAWLDENVMDYLHGEKGNRGDE